MYRNEYPVAIEAVTKKVTGKAGVLNQDIRQAIVEQTAVSPNPDSPITSPIPANLQAYLTKVAHHSYKVTDQDINRLKYAGYSEDEIFEATVSAALGAALARVNKGFALFAE